MTTENSIRDLEPTPTTKRCPGFTPDGIAPHELPADLQNFNSNKGGKDGLSTRCRNCGNRYGKAWAAAKKAGQKFSVREPALYPAPVPDDTPLVPDAQGFLKTPQELEEAGQSVSPIRAPSSGGGVSPDNLPAPNPGWEWETIDGVAYALPTAPAELGKPAGQAALERVNQARAAARRKRDAERKRTERANAKAAKAATA